MLAVVLLSLAVLLVVLTPWAVFDAQSRGRTERIVWTVLLPLSWPAGALVYGLARAGSGALRVTAVLVLLSQGALVWMGARNAAEESGGPRVGREQYEAVGRTERLRLSRVFGSYGSLGNDDYVEELRLSRDGSRLAVSGGRTLRLWDVDGVGIERTLQSLPANDVLAGWLSGQWLGRGSTLALSEDGQTLATERGSVTLRIGLPLVSIAIDLVRGNRHRVDLWTVDGHASIRAHDGRVTSIGFAGGRLWTASHDGSLAEWSPQGRLLRRLPTGRGWIVASSVTPDGTFAIVSAWQPYGADAPGSHLGLYDLNRGELRFELSGHDDRAHAVGFAEGGRVALSASFDGFRYWDVETGRELRFVPADEPLTRVSFSPDGTRAASGSPRLDVWDLTRGEVVDRIDLAAADDEPAAVAFARDGSFLVLGTRRGALLQYAWTD